MKPWSAPLFMMERTLSPSTVVSMISNFWSGYSAETSSMAEAESAASVMTRS